MGESEKVFIADDYTPGSDEVFTELSGLESAGRIRVVNRGDNAVVIKQSELDAMLRERYELGLSKGITEKENFRRETVKNLLSMSRTAEGAIGDAVRGAESELLNLVMDIAGRIVKKEIETGSEEVLRNQIHACLDYMEERMPVLLRVNPADRAEAESILGEAGYSIPEKLKLVDDPSVERGGCILKMDRGSLRAVISEQMAKIEKALCQEYERTYQG